MSPADVPTELPITVDASDGLVALCAFSLTWAAGRYLSASQRRDLRQWLPLLAMGLAVLVRVLIAMAEGQTVSLGDVLRAFAAGAVATWTQSAARAPEKAAHRRQKGEGATGSGSG